MITWYTSKHICFPLLLCWNVPPTHPCKQLLSNLQGSAFLLYGATRSSCHDSFLHSIVYVLALLEEIIFASVSAFSDGLGVTRGWVWFRFTSTDSAQCVSHRCFQMKGENEQEPKDQVILGYKGPKKRIREKRRFRQRSSSSRRLQLCGTSWCQQCLLRALAINETCREAGARKRKNRFWWNWTSDSTRAGWSKPQRI